MSSLKVNQIKSKLMSMFGHHLDLSDIGTSDPEREQKVLSRCLAALAIYLQAGCSESEAASAVWDGSDDNGIDAAYFDVPESKVIFVQSKWINKGSGEPEAKDVRTFVSGVKDAIEQESTNFHPRLHARFNDIALRLGTPGTSVHLLLVTTGSSTLSRHSDGAMGALLKELNGEDPEPIATKEIYGLSEVYSGLANDPLQNVISLDATILEWSYVATPFPAYYGMIDGLQLKEWWKKHGKGLVSANIRHSLGATEVNNEIKNTATSSPEKFWYYNNGITLIADDVAKAPVGASSRSAGVFSFKNASIVNGAQTVSSLAKVAHDEGLANVRVLIRVILLKGTPAGFGREVTRTNNLQNRVEPRDFVAQDPEQKRIRQEMAIEGVDYQFVRSDEAIATPTACELMEVTTALACASGDPTMAVHVKTGIGRFFADLKKTPYISVFNPSVSGAKAFNATILSRQIEAWIESSKKSLSRKSGTEWGVLVHGNRILAAAVFVKYGVTKLSQPISDFQRTHDKSALNAICKEVHSRMVETINAEYPGKFLSVLFKNPTMSKRVFDASIR